MPASLQHLLAARSALPSAGDERYADRAASGRRLAALLSRYRGGPGLALALTPGGVAVAGELSHALRISLDAFVVREFRVPGWPTAVAGAVSEGGGLCLNAAALRLPGVAACDIWRAAQREQAGMAHLVDRYRGERPPALLPRSPVILVDDGLGSGLGHLAAIRALRRYHPQGIVIATPFGTEMALAAVERWVDAVACLEPVASGEDDPVDRWICSIDDDEAAGLLGRLRHEVEQV